MIQLTPEETDKLVKHSYRLAVFVLTSEAHVDPEIKVEVYEVLSLTRDKYLSSEGQRIIKEGSIEYDFSFDNPNIRERGEIK